METATQIKDRIAKLAATMPQDEDPTAEARAEKRAEKRLGIVLEEGTFRNMSPEDLRNHPEWIKVGMGATMRTGMGGLYRPYTVIEVQRGGKLLKLQADKVVQVTKGTGWEDNGEKTFEPDPKGRIETVSLRKDGTYIGKGAPLVWYATRYIIGMRRDWTDFSQ